MIRGSHLSAIAERSHFTERQEPPNLPLLLIICANCKHECVHVALGLCATCYGYQKRHGGEPRPLHLIDQLSKRKSAPRWCMTCGNPKLYAGRRCNACHDYWIHHRKPRPRWLWDDEICCGVCDYPKSASGRRSDGRVKFYKGLCLACYLYGNRTGRTRPEHLWGKGTYGWCSCGNPAEYHKNGFNLCTICADE